MKRYNKTTISLLLSGLILMLNACEGETATSTEDKKDLKPVGELITLTGDKEIGLLFQTSNYESDFMGYRVWCAKGEASDLGLKELTPFDLGAKENETILSKFAVVDEAVNETIKVTKDLLKVKGTATVGIQEYKLSKCGDKDLENGVVYTFFVTSVNNDGTNGQNSWSSNIVSDVPSNKLLDKTIDVAVSAEGKSVPLNLAPTSETLAGIVLTEKTTPPTEFGCTTAGTDGHFYVEYKSNRVWLRAVNGSALIDMGYRGDIVRAEDEAVEHSDTESVYFGCQERLALYEGKTYYYVIKSGSNKKYGKIVVEESTTTATNGSVKLNIVIQPKENELRFLL